MRFLILHSAADLYGSGKILLLVTRILKNEGHEPTVVLPEKGPLVEKFRNEGVAVKISDLGILRRKYMTPWGMLNRTFFLVKAVLLLKRIVKEEDIDIVYSNTLAVFSGALAARLTRKEHVWHVHEILSAPSPAIKLFSHFLNKYTDKIIVVSKAVKNHLLNEMRVDKTVISVVYNGIDPMVNEDRSNLRKEWGVNDDTICIGMVGRVHPWKGQKYFLKIANKLKEYSNEPLQFIMVGDPFPGYEYLNNEIEELKRNLGLEADVIDLGYRTDINAIMSGLDVFILPSTEPDPFPTVILEAMSLGLLIAATNHGGVPEMIIDKESGVLIPWNNEERSAKKILELTSDPDIKINMKNAARKRFQSEFLLDSYHIRLKEVLL